MIKYNRKKNNQKYYQVERKKVIYVDSSNEYDKSEEEIIDLTPCKQTLI